MEFTADRDALASALASAGAAAASAGAVWGPQIILTGVKLSLAADDLTITGSNGDSITIIETIQVDGVENGEAVIGSKVPLGAVKALLEGEVQVRLRHATAPGDSGWLNIAQDTSEFRMPALVSDGYLSLEEPDVPPTEFGSESLWLGMGQVLPPALSAKNRPGLNCVVIDPDAGQDGQATLVATDAYRMHVKQVDDVKGQVGSLTKIPAAAAKELLRLHENLPDEDADIPIHAQMGNGRAAFSLAGTSTLITAQSVGGFPDYSSYLSDPERALTKIEVEREVLADFIKRIGVMSARDTPIQIHPASGQLRLLASDPEHGEGDMVVSATVTGKRDVVTAYKSNFLADAVASCEGDSLVMALPQPGNTPGSVFPTLFFSPEHPDFTAAVSPVLLPNA